MIPNILQINLMLFLLPLFWAVPVSASIAMNLDQYKNTLAMDITGVRGTSFSGVAFYPPSNTLYVVDDADLAVYEFSTGGDVVRIIGLSGFEDTEGIAYQAEDYFFIVEERRANVVRVQLPAEGTGPVLRENGAALNIAAGWGNTGLEDVACLASANTAYAVKEKDPSHIYTITLDENGSPVDFEEDVPFSIEGMSGDAAGLYALADGNFLILSQEEKKLVGYSPSGEILSELSLDMAKPEGVTMDPSDGRIYIVGEPREFYVFESGVSPIQMASAQGEFFRMYCDPRDMFAGAVIFQYHVPAAYMVRLELFTMQGKRVEALIHELKPAGTYQTVWKALGLSPGVYTFKYSAGKAIKSIRYVLF